MNPQIAFLDNIPGFFDEFPEIGQRFVFFYDDGGVITTSLVQDIEANGEYYVFDTVNSTYTLEVRQVH
jgi:hypothetical protein